MFKYIGGTDLTTGAHRSAIPSGPTPPTRNTHETPDIRPDHVFHGLSAYPTAAHATGAPGAPAMVPALQGGGGFDVMGRPSVATVASSRSKPAKAKNTDDPDSEDIFGGLPEGKRRKFILVDDAQRSCRVRVKVMLDRVDIGEIPDSYRLAGAVYPRAYFPVQMKVPPGRVVPGNRYRDESDLDDADGPATTGRTFVPAPALDGEIDTALPQVSRSRHRKDKVLNDLGYRMSWSQSRVFAERPMFLQRSCECFFIYHSMQKLTWATVDAYRNKMHATIANAGHAPSSKASHFETRRGKHKWRKRTRRDNGNSQFGDSAYRIEAEEVEG